VLLVPRQLARVGMTGNVPYYGGRLTPAQAYAASHPAPAKRGPDSLAALEQLLAEGVITQEEHDQLRARVSR
jgi:hypothetical protein